MATRSKQGKYKGKNSVLSKPSVADPTLKGPIVTRERAVEEKSDNTKVKANNEVMRPVTIANREKNDLGSLQMEVNRYSAALAKIPCNIEVNSDMEGIDTSLNNY